MSTDPGPTPIWGDRTLRRVLIFFALILAVLVFVVVASLHNLNRSVATSDWVNHTHALISELDALQPTLVAAEGELAKYLLTSDSRDQQAYQDKFAELGERVDVATALTADSPQERDQFAPIAALLARRAALANRIAQLKRTGDSDALQKLLAENRERNDQRELGRLLERFRENQTTLLTARDRASFQQAETTRWTVLSGVVLDFLLLCGAAWLIRHDLAARRLAHRLLQQTNADLEDRVRERTVELSATNAQLVAQNLEDRWSQQALEHQHRYNLLIIDSIADAVIVVTKLVNISRLNPAAIHLSGFEPVELIDRPLARILQLAPRAADPTKPSFDPLARALVEGHEMRDRPATITTKGGQSITVRLNLYPLRDRDKVVGGVVILQSNVPASS